MAHQPTGDGRAELPFSRSKTRLIPVRPAAARLVTGLVRNHVYTGLLGAGKEASDHCPWHDGKVERLNRTLTTERAYRQAITGNDQRTAALAPWFKRYSTHRRHSALGGQPPIGRLAPT